MRSQHVTTAMLALLGAGFALCAAGQAPPPVAPVRPVTTNYFGTKVVDPYRYMENLKDPAVQAWMRAQNAYSRAVLASIPGRAKLLARLAQLTRGGVAPVIGAERLPGDLYFYQKGAGLYVRHGLAGEERSVVDASNVTLSPSSRAKGRAAIQYYAVSPNEKYVAVGFVPGGSENDLEIHVFEVATGRETGDVILHGGWGLNSGEPYWLPGSRSFLYSRIGDRRHSFLHVLGTDPAADRAVFGSSVPASYTSGTGRWNYARIAPGSRYAVGIVGGTSPPFAFYIEPVSDVGTDHPAWRRLAGFSDDVTDIAVHGEVVYVLTYKNAPRYKVVRTDARHPDLATAQLVVPPGRAVITAGDIIYGRALNPAQDALYVQLLDGGAGRVLRVPYAQPRWAPGPNAAERKRVARRSRAGSRASQYVAASHPQELSLPQGSIIQLRSDPRVPGVLMTMSFWTRSPGILFYNPAARHVEDTGLWPAANYNSPVQLESRQVQVPSYDGTLVPLTIVSPKSIRRDGSNPTLLTGYGAYGTTEPARFGAPALTWYEQGGVLAYCGVRGGGEYGEEWHRAGMQATKPNTWKDFIACAQYLIAHKYTSPARLAGRGISAGGILIGRAITARPDLFAVAIDDVGISDTLRLHRVTDVLEFGNIKTAAGFHALYAMSPYAHVKPGARYPAVMLQTGMNDPRVMPWQLAKLTARLQAATTSGRPVLLLVNYQGGHGVTSTVPELLRQLTDMHAFMLWQMGVPGFQPAARH